MDTSPEIRSLETSTKKQIVTKKLSGLELTFGSGRLRNLRSDIFESTHHAVLRKKHWRASLRAVLPLGYIVTARAP